MLSAHDPRILPAMARKPVLDDLGLDVSLPPDADYDGWTEVQRRFVFRYMIHKNASRACREVGITREEHSSGHAAVMGARMLRKPHIKKWIEREERRLFDEVAHATPVTILHEISKIAYANPARLMRVENGIPITDLRDADANDLAALKSFSTEERREPNPKWNREAWEAAEAIAQDLGEPNQYPETEWIVTHKVKIETYDKLSALNTLGKHYKMFSDRLEVDVNVVGDADRIAMARKAARERLASGGETPMIDVTPERTGTNG